MSNTNETETMTATELYLQITTLREMTAAARTEWHRLSVAVVEHAWDADYTVAADEQMTALCRAACERHHSLRTALGNACLRFHATAEMTVEDFEASYRSHWNLRAEAA